VVVRDIATGNELTGATDERGTYRVTLPSPGTYLVLVSAEGFSNAVRTVVVEAAAASIDVPVQLDLGTLTDQVTVTPARAARDLRQVPLHVETFQGEALERLNLLSTGDAIANAISVMPVISSRTIQPRLGLQSDAS
jgi:hypothetical protein